MNFFYPTLIVNRLQVYKNDIIVFDEKFHKGVNIIRGSNGSGKSAIVNFIYWGLGGEHPTWTKTARECTEIYLELEINKKNVSIKRKLYNDNHESISFFIGNLEKAVSSDKWKIYCKNINDKSNYSNYFFELLGLEQEPMENLSMHHILRLLYIDQKSSSEVFMRMAPFDSKINREKVYNLLLGVTNQELYSLTNEIKKYEKEYDYHRNRYRYLVDFFSNQNAEESNSTAIAENLRKLQDELATIDQELATVRTKNLESIQKQLHKNAGGGGLFDNLSEPTLDIFILADNIEKKKHEYREIADKLQKLQNEIQDSYFFIGSLEMRKRALEESELVRKEFHELFLVACPHCLAELDKPELHSKICYLCKTPSSDKEKYQPNILRIKQELIFQIQESEKINEKKIENRKKLEYERAQLTNELKQLHQKFIDASPTQAAPIDAAINKLHQRRGEILKEIEYQNRAALAAHEMESYKREYETVQSICEKKKQDLIKLKDFQKSKEQKAHSVIEKLALALLKADGNHQTEFQSGRHIEINISENTYSLDGVSNFSESSNIYLKNSIYFAIFFASLEQESFKYPRFILCDNIEDKGMMDKRIHSFQNAIVELSEQSNTDHQIIFTASSVAPELEIFCIGEYYDADTKTLKFS